jgi:diguanylate cyclase (GGDEF)-like protein
MADIDDFKAVNDTHGHAAGDAVLRAAARALASAVRDTDLVFRYGGEEFAVLLPACSLEDGKKVAERMRRSVAALSVDPGGGKPPLSVTVSLGVGACTGAAGADSIVSAADEAMYRAKRGGKNRVE